MLPKPGPAKVTPMATELDALFGEDNVDRFDRISVAPFRMGLADLHKDAQREPERFFGATMSHTPHQEDVDFGQVIKGSLKGVELEPNNFVAVCKNPCTEHTAEQATLSALVRWSRLLFWVADETSGEQEVTVRVFSVVQHLREKPSEGIRQTLTSLGHKISYLEACGTMADRKGLSRLIGSLAAAGDYGTYAGKLDGIALRPAN